jgi:hypothetical protein
VFLLDSLLVGGLRFVLDKVATVVDTEMNDESALHDQLLAAHTRLEVGEIGEAEFAVLEADVLARLHEIRRRRQEGPVSDPSADYTVTGVEASIEGDEH